ncbi:MAG: immune inhibitor A [Bacteroidetes bacterium]|nr:immune inhibitor A [Bacteroidota bacterium]
MKTVIICLLAFVISAFPQDHKKVKIFINNDLDLNKVAELSLDLEDAGYDKSGNISLFVNDAEFSELQQTGLGYEVLIDDWKTYYNSLPVLTEEEKAIVKMKSNMSFGVSGFKFGSMGGFYTFDEILADLDTMFQLYPNLITEKDSIGTSHEGRTIWAVKISNNPNINEDEPAVGFDALTHAREPQGMATLMYFMWYLLENYGTDPEVTYLLDNREIYCVPCFNPDGYEYNRQNNPNGGGLWRKNRRDNGGSFGVDLNRNFGYKWGYDNNGSSPNPTSNTYRGPAPFSEPESQGVSDLAILHNYGTHFNMHAYSDAYLYPWGYINQQCPDSLTYREFAGDMTALNGYVFGTSGEILGYQSNGTVRDWMYGEQVDKSKIFGYTVEFGSSSDGFWPNQNRIFPIAQINVKPNMYHAFVAGEYVKLNYPNFSQEYFLPGDNVELMPEFKNKGLATAYDLTIELSSPSGLVTVNNGSVSIDSIEARSLLTATSPLSFTISNSATVEQEIPLAFTTYSNGSLMSTDTVTIIIGFPVVVFADTTNDPTELWTITATPSNPKWEATTVTYYSDPTSFTDSKNGNYSNNATVTMTLTNAIDINGYTNPRLTFRTKFDIESNWDFGQVDVSTNNGVTWIPLEGEYTEPGVGSFQPAGEPVYDGVVIDWVQERISLANYLSSEFKIRFQLESDGAVRKDGWYVDDIGILIYTIPTSKQDNVVRITQFELEQNYPNPFNPSTMIKYSIPSNVKHETSNVSLIVYDVLGNEVAILVNEEKIVGNYEIEFNANNLSSGIYYYRLVAGSYTDTRKMILLK